MALDRRILLAVPLAAAALAGVAFWVMLNRMQDGTFDPRGVPSMLTGKPVPAFKLPGLGGDGFTSADLTGGQKPVVVNFFASWCVPCVEEHPVLMELRRQGIAVWGIAYKDSPANTAAFLKRHGSPFQRVASDDPGRVAIDWGITGVPETFVVDQKGVVRWHYVGPLSRVVVEEQLMPALKRLTS